MTTLRSRLDKLEAKNPPSRGVVAIYEELPDFDGPPMYQGPNGRVAYEDIPRANTPHQGIGSIIVHLPRGRNDWKESPWDEP